MNSIDLLTLPEYREFVRKKAASTSQNKPYEVMARKKDGTILTVEVISRNILWNGNPLRVASIRDITERRKAEEELKVSREQLRDLAAHLQSAREEERISIAREIHDELGQSLTALKIDLSLLAKNIPKEQRSLVMKIKSMLTLIDICIQTVKRIASELRPGLLDDVGIIAAMDWQREEFQNRTGIRCEFIANQEEFSLDLERSTALFRIFQEALTNVARHSNASRIKINLKKKMNRIELKFKDNGRGITKEQISSPKSFGLIGIKERAQYFGGSVEITGAPDKGTTLSVIIPFRKEE